ncbi:hypothetical protein BB558_007176 [Smittium angustum]|uniref:GrpE protein homolog n=1 Tax=Smittium angustum TaxID=133377 RepID=A0A2U1IVS1_SMIAN|nr:hypothetical protein BB558_007176 [Smittium angustum]
MLSITRQRLIQRSTLNSIARFKLFSQYSTENKESSNEKSCHSAEDLKKTLEEKEAILKETKDNYLRALAETENVRQRYKTEVESTKKLAIRGFSKDLIDTVDILTIALKNVPAEIKIVENSHEDHKKAVKAIEDLSLGVEMTLKNLIKTLERHGVKEFNPHGKKFDPNTCQALFQVPMPGMEPGHVFVVEKKGYMIHDYVLRPAEVGVVSDNK